MTPLATSSCFVLYKNHFNGISTGLMAQWIQHLTKELAVYDSNFTEDKFFNFLKKILSSIIPTCGISIDLTCPHLDIYNIGIFKKRSFQLKIIDRKQLIGLYHWRFFIGPSKSSSKSLISRR